MLAQMPVRRDRIADSPIAQTPEMFFESQKRDDRLKFRAHPRSDRRKLLI
jgi:hypothetical protein